MVTENAVHKHIGNIFARLGLAPTDAGHRRVLAVLAFLNRAAAGPRTGYAPPEGPAGRPAGTPAAGHRACPAPGTVSPSATAPTWFSGVDR